MSDTTQDHAAAIKQEADRLYYMALIQEPDRDQLYRHADALAAELAEATARAAKLRRYALAWEDDFREGFVTKELADPRMQEFVENTIQIMRGHSGIDDDLTVESGDRDTAPGDTEKQ